MHRERPLPLDSASRRESDTDGGDGPMVQGSTVYSTAFGLGSWSGAGGPANRAKAAGQVELWREMISETELR